MVPKIIFSIMIFHVSFTYAQSKQVKLYLQQIAANKGLIEYIQKGYKIAGTGLTSIGNIRNGEFNLHEGFFGALKGVNPKIKNSALVIDVLSLKINTVKICKNTINRITDSGVFTAQEEEYIRSVFRRLSENTAILLDETLVTITNNKYQMSDDERIRRLETLHKQMQANYVYAHQFINPATLLATQRIKERQEVETSRLLRGIIANK